LKYRHEIQCKISKGKSKKNCLFWWMYYSSIIRVLFEYLHFTFL
jgi:hypothetical protein